MLLTRRGFLAACLGAGVLAAGASVEALPATRASPAMLSRTCYVDPASHHAYWYEMRTKIRELEVHGLPATMEECTTGTGA